MVKLTKEQQKALFKIYQRDWPDHPWANSVTRHYRRLRRTATPYFDNSGCVMVPWRGMYLGIETDGYTHS